MLKMKLLKLIFLIGLPLNFLHAELELFEAANESYIRGDYAQAIKKYEQLLAEDVKSENIHYNIANAYYHTEQVGKSILNFERALKLNPGSEKIKHNLRLAYLKTKDKIEPLPQLGIVSKWYSFLNTYNASQWAKAAAVLAFVSLVLLVLAKLKNQSLLKLFATLSIVVCISLIFLANRKHHYDYNHHFAIVMSPSVALKVSPNTSAENVMEIHEGLKLQIVDQVDEWSQVRLEDGNEAWLPSTSIVEI